MPPHALVIPSLFLALFLGTAHATSKAPMERLRVQPLDTGVVALDSGVSAAVLADEGDDASPAALIAREFHPRFATAIAKAARRVEVIRSSKDSPDRYTLRLDSLALSTRSRAVARRFVPPSSPGFDPATGEATAGDRRGRVEGPGWMNTLAATARWTLRDHVGDSVLASGTATGSSSFRGDARRSDWDAAARDLALAVLRGTPFAPP